MPWLEQWSYKIDGTEINDRTTLFTQIPELSNVFEQDIILAQIDGDYPVYIRTQPTEGRISFLINIAYSSPASFDTTLTSLKALFTQVPHTLTVQARGMSTTKTLTFIPQGMMVDYKQRLVTVSAVVPKPVLT